MGFSGNLRFFSSRACAPSTMSQSLLAHLQHGLIRIATIPPRVLASPPSQPRRASVALILRVRPSAEDEPWLQAKWRHGEVREEDAHFFPSMMRMSCAYRRTGRKWNSQHRGAPSSVLLAALGAAWNGRAAVHQARGA